MAKGPGGFSVGRVSIQVVPDTSNFRKELQAKLKKEIKGLKVEIPVDVNAKKAVTQLKVLDSAVKRLNGRQINIGANVNKSGDLDGLSKSLSKVGKSASDASEGFSHFGRTGAIVVAVVLLLAPALALIATLLAGLPSLLFAFGGAAAAVALGLEGIKKAAQGFSPTIDRLKASLSKTFADQLTKPFIELNKIAPVLDKGLNAIAVSLSGIIKDLIGFATSVQGMKQLENILQNSAKFFEQLRPAILDGAKAFATLASAASNQFGILANTLARFSNQFGDIVNQAVATGTLSKALQGLNDVLDSLLRGFNSLFQAGLEAMGVLGGPIVTLFDGFIGAIVALMPALNALSKLVFNVLGEAFKQLIPIFNALTPSFTLLADVLGDVLVGALKVIGPMLTRVAEILNAVLLQALEKIQPFIGPFLNFLSQMGALISETLLVAFGALAPLLAQFLQFVSDILTALTPLAPVLIELATMALRTLADILVELGPELTHLGEELFPRLVEIAKQLVPIISDIAKVIIEVLPYLADLASFILDLVIPAMSAMLQTVNSVWPVIKAVIVDAMKVIQGIVDVVLGFITGDWDRAMQGLKDIATGGFALLKDIVKLGLTAVLEAFVALPGRVINALLGLPSSLFNSGRAMMQGLVDGIKSMAQTVVNQALSVVKQVRDLLPFSPAKTGPFSGKGYTLYSGQALMEDWAKGIEEGAPSAVKAMEDAASLAQASLDIQAAVAAEGFGGLGAQVARAIEGMEIKADGTNIARVVNKANNMNARR
jgi:phage-related protein